jgi:hypothetical protein
MVYVPPPLAPSYFPVPPVYLYGYSLRCEPYEKIPDKYAETLRELLRERSSSEPQKLRWKRRPACPSTAIFYDVKPGRLIEVPAATEAGKA